MILGTILALAAALLLGSQMESEDQLALFFISLPLVFVLLLLLLLLAAGAVVHVVTSAWGASWESSAAIRVLPSSRARAVTKWLVATTILLVVAGLSFVGWRTGQNNQKLLEAAAQGNSQASIALLKAGADPNARGLQQRTPLHLATKGGHPSIVAELLDRGADPNVRDLGHATPLQVAAESGDLRIVAALLDAGADANARDPQQRTPLHLATESSHPSVVAELLDQGADPNADDLDHITPLHLAVWNQDEEVREALLSAGAMDLWTPLHEAAAQGSTKQIAELLNAGANPNAPDATRFTPLHHAARHGHAEVVAALIDAGANLNVPSAGAMSEVAQRLVGQFVFAMFAPFMVLAGADGDVDTIDGEWTPLHLATRYGHAEVVAVLLNAGANANARTSHGRTSLYFATQSGHAGIQAALFAAGANMETGSGSGPGQ